jgi:hypothetical protein
MTLKQKMRMGSIYYSYINDGKELEVTKDRMYGQYSGTVNIPETVTYMGHTRQVTSIGKEAFSCCYELQTVSIPNTVNHGDSDDYFEIID